MIKVISEETRESIKKLFIDADSSIQIISPFLSIKTAELLSSVLKKKKDIECTVITRIYLKDLLEGVNSTKAISILLSSGVKVYSLQGLHAKLYMFDEETVIIGSANFTMAGISKNFELSILTDESCVIEKASLIFDDLLSHCIDNAGIVDEELLETVEADYSDAYRNRQKDSGFSTIKMYGAERMNKGIQIKSLDWKSTDCQIEDKDPVFDLFSDVKKHTIFNHNVWVKFEGKSENRQPGNELPSLTQVDFEGSKRYILNFRNRPRGIQDDDAIFIVSLTNDSNEKPTTRIVGRGKARTFINRCIVKPDWIKQYPWMDYYKYFCEVYDVQLLNLERMNCIPLSQVYDVLDKRTYTSTIDKEEVKNMAQCQCRRSHIQMTLDAKTYIDEEINKLADKYGFIEDIEKRTV